MHFYTSACHPKERSANLLIKSTLSPEAIRKLKLREEITAHHGEHVKIHQPRSCTTCRKNRYEPGGVSVFLPGTGLGVSGAHLISRDCTWHQMAVQLTQTFRSVKHKCRHRLVKLIDLDSVDNLLLFHISLYLTWILLQNYRCIAFNTMQQGYKLGFVSTKPSGKKKLFSPTLGNKNHFLVPSFFFQGR